MNKLHNIKNYFLEARLFKQRVIVAAVVVALLLGLLILRLAVLQLFHHGYYTHLSEHNQLEQLPIEPNRGLIYDRNGVLLAENIPVFTLAIIPDQVKDLTATITNLQKIITITPDNITQFKKVLKRHQHFDHVPLKFKLTQEEVENFQIDKYSFPGVVIDATLIRHYPLGNYMASVLGYVGRINSNDLESVAIDNYGASNFIGKVGIEKHFEEQLHGKTGFQQIEVDAAGHVVRTVKNILPIPGTNLHLTIDSKLQKAAQIAMQNERGAVVAIDPQNGEVLALVSNPTYDPNLFANGIDTATFQQLQNSQDKPMYNRAIRGHFPIASTIKPFIAIQALNTGIINTRTSIDDPGRFRLPNSEHIYWDVVHEGHGIVNVSKAIMISCDTFFYTLAPKLGIEKIDDILEKFGFGTKTGIEMNEELDGIIASPSWKLAHTKKSWYPGDTIISVIGQGFMTTTPLQLANAAATLAKHGIRYKPHLLLKSINANNETVVTKPTQEQPIVLRENRIWNIVINAMQEVVRNISGTARGRYGTDYPYTVAGKTGSAQLFHHKYNIESPTAAEEAAITKRLRNHSLFIAFAPIENPKIAIAVVAENSMTAPIIARKVIDAYLLNKMPETQSSIKSTPAPPKSPTNNEIDNDNTVVQNDEADSVETANTTDTDSDEVYDDTAETSDTSYTDL